MRILFFVVIFLFILGFALWLAGLKEPVLIVWKGNELRASTGAAIFMVIKVALIALLLIRIILYFIMLPHRIDGMRLKRRKKNIDKALEQALIALQLQDMKTLRPYATQILRLDPQDPRGIILMAAVHEAEGEGEEAKRLYEGLSKKGKARQLGFYGLYRLARERDDEPEMKRLLSRAQTISGPKEWRSRVRHETTAPPR